MFGVHKNFDLTTGVKNNTICVINDSPNLTHVIYHKTIVFTHQKKRTASLNPAGIITLRTGGHDTKSTRLVINRALEQSQTDWRIVREKGRSFLKDSNGLIMPLVDGMELHI
jgi:hypothetical protein